MRKVISTALALTVLFSTAVTFFALQTPVTAASVGLSGSVSVFISFEDGTTGEVEVYPNDSYAREVWTLTNQERAKAGLPSLIWDSSQEAAALQRAAEATVAGDKNITHTRPNGTQWHTALDNPSLPVGENLAGGMTTPAAVVEAWMKSAGHRKNILNAGFTSMTVGCVQETDGTYHWVQLFGGATAAKYTVTFHSNGGSTVATQSVVEGGFAVRPSDPTRYGYGFAGWFRDPSLSTPWNFTSDSVNGNIALYAKWTSSGSTGGSSGNGGPRGGGSGAGGTTTADQDVTGATSANVMPTAGSNVAPDGSVSTSQIKLDTAKAVATTSGNSAAVRTQNAASISQAALRAMVNAAGGKSVVLHADTVLNNVVVGRLYIDPGQFSGEKSELKLGVYTQNAKAGSVKAHFEKWFGNRVVVVSLEQQDHFGARVQIAVKVDLSRLDTGNLVFYSFHQPSNTYTRIDNPAYFIDNKGYLHFYTEKAGCIVITDSVLTRK